MLQRSDVTEGVSRELSTWKFNFHRETRSNVSRLLFFFLSFSPPPFFTDLISPGRRGMPITGDFCIFSLRMSRMREVARK